jgi:hypothetical protein
VAIAGRSVRSDRPVIAVDLEGMRRASNEKILGVIGMDVLRSCRVQIDFDSGRIRFLRELPEDAAELGEQFPLRIGNDGVPYLRGSLGRGSHEWFVLDSGAMGNSLAAAAFDEMLERKEIQLGTSFASVTAAGELRGARGRMAEFRVGQFRHAGLRFARMETSSLGLRYLARFQVLLDFPGKSIYLREGDHFDLPEPNATSGLTLNWIDGTATVTAVTAGGAGEKAGAQCGDAIVKIDGKTAGTDDPFALRQILTLNPGRRVALTIRRGDRVMDLVLTLEGDREATP